MRTAPLSRFLVAASLTLASATVVIAGPGSALQTDAVERSHRLMPVPAEISFRSGQLSLPDVLGVNLLDHRDGRLERGVVRALDRLERQTGSRVRGRLESGRAALVTVRVEGPGQAVQDVDEDESYRITVDAEGILLSAPTTVGALRGLETLLQLVELGGSGYVVPYVLVRDRPRFPWRGLLVDVARNFMPIDVLERNLDAMAAVKMNVLHLHLTEDQSFRIESKRFPRLHELGSDGRHLSQEQVRELVAYARDRGIRVVPEFDMPGHTTSWFVGYPELAAQPGPYQRETRWGIMDPAMDPTREEVYGFLSVFLTEMAGLFPDRYLHIGGDEVNGVAWNGSEPIQQFIRDQDLVDNEGLQAYFNQRIARILTANGKTVVGWQEIVHPDLPRTIVVQSWLGHEELAENARAGYRGILSWGYYLDHMLPASFHYSVDPLGHPAFADLSEAERDRVLGGEACMWSELVNAETIDSRIWPRAAAIAERLWSSAAVTDEDDMYRRLEQTSQWLEWTGVTHRSAFRPMLQRLAGYRRIDALEVLANVVQPPRYYARNANGEYGTATALSMLADAARPESSVARVFGDWVTHYLAADDPAAAAELRDWMSLWSGNHERLLPVLRASPLLAEVEPVSAGLSAVATLGLEAVGYLESGVAPAPGWVAAAEDTLERAGQMRASLLLVIVDPVLQLVLAAGDLGSGELP